MSDQITATVIRPFVETSAGANIVAKNFSEPVENSPSAFSLGLIGNSEVLVNSFYRSVKKKPRQQRTVSSLQQQSPQQSPFLLCTLLISFKNHGEKIVKKEK